MNFLMETGLLSEMACGNNFAYILSDDSIFLPTEYKVLQSRQDDCFIRCMKMLWNGRMQFYYLTDGYKSLAGMIPSLDVSSLASILTNVFETVLSVKENGFLTCQNIDIAPDKIFVDPGTYKASLIYLPVSRRLFADESAFENELRTSLIKMISQQSQLESVKTTLFFSDLSNGMLSIRDLYERLKSRKTPELSGKEDTASRNDSRTENTRLRIVALNAPTQLEIEVTKDCFVIGKKASSVDGVISFNKMISRVHCQITRENGQFMLTDLQSANGTYVNRMRLTAGQPHPIRNGDIVRLANSDFQVVIS